MKFIKTLPSFVILTLAMTLFVGCGHDDWKATDVVEVLGESKSPDGKYIATVFSCSGGGSAGYTYTNVNLREVSEKLDQRDFLLGKHLWHSFADISVDWKDSESLVVSYRWAGDHPDYRTRNAQTVPMKGNVKIHYIVEENS